MIVLGITGTTGSGKTTLLQQVKAIGGRTMDCDAIYHTLLKNCTPMLTQLQQQFPSAFENGSLVRSKLAALVFENQEKLNILNEITHKYVINEVKKQLFSAHEEGCRIAAIDAIALIESGLGSYCDLTVCVSAPEKLRIKRLMEREGISEAYALARIRAQKSDTQLAAMCDTVLHNDGEKEAFEAACRSFLSKHIGAADAVQKQKHESRFSISYHGKEEDE